MNSSQRTPAANNQTISSKLFPSTGQKVSPNRAMDAIGGFQGDVGFGQVDRAQTFGIHGTPARHGLHVDPFAIGTAGVSSDAVAMMTSPYRGATGSGGNSTPTRVAAAFGMPATPMPQQASVRSPPPTPGPIGGVSTTSLGTAPPRVALRNTLLNNAGPTAGFATSFDSSAAAAAGALGPTASSSSSSTATTAINAMAEESNVETTWITVFGFRPEHAVDVLHHFSQYGEILKHVVGGENWLHIQYAEPYATQAALAKRTRIVGSSMVGVEVCVDQSVMAGAGDALAGALRRASTTNPMAAVPFASTPSAITTLRPVASNGGSSASMSSSLASSSLNTTTPRNAVREDPMYKPMTRDYSVQANPVLTQQQTSLYSKLMDIVLGV